MFQLRCGEEGLRDPGIIGGNALPVTGQWRGGVGLIDSVHSRGR